MATISLRSFLILLSLRREPCILTLPMGISSEDICAQLAHLSPMDEQTYEQLLHLRRDRANTHVRIDDKTQIDDLTTRARFNNQYVVPGALALSNKGVLSIGRLDRFLYGATIAQLITGERELAGTGRYYDCKPLIVGDMPEMLEDRGDDVAKRLGCFGNGFFKYHMKVCPDLRFRMNMAELDGIGDDVDRLGIYHFERLTMADALSTIGVVDDIAKAIEASNNDRTLILGNKDAG